MTHYKILVVDDDPDDRDILNEAFLANSFSHHLILSSAQEVFTHLQSVETDEALPRLIITDLNMPGISGYELLRALSGMRRYQHIAVIVCSTSSLKAHVEMCLSLGAMDYVTKPSVASDYRQLARQWCRIAEVAPQ